MQPHLFRRTLFQRAWTMAAGGAGIVAAACGQGGADRAPTQNPSAVRGRVVHWYVSRFPFHEDLGADFVAEFRAKHPNIEYVPELVVGNRFEKLVAAAAAGAAPDIGMAGSWQMQELAAGGIAAPVDGYLKASRVVKQADLWPTHVRDLTYKGKPYGMPFGPDVRVLYAGTEVLRSAGLDAAQPARTWDELEEHTRRVYRDEAANPARLGFPPFWGTGGRSLWLIPFWQLGGETLSPDGQKITINTEPGIKALEWLKKIHDMQGGWGAIEALRTQTQKRESEPLVNGVTGYYFATFSSRKEPVMLAVPDFRFGFAPWPLPKGGRRANYGGCHAFCITTQAKMPDAAWQFLEFLADEDHNLRFALRYDRIPIRVKTAQSAAYHHNDPFLKLAVEEMRYRRFQVPAPGGTEISGLHSAMVADAMSGKRSIRDALQDGELQMQQALDKWKR
ncbi:MAG: extracellular solute-binding protein [Chloroflexi bacterium]|nr:extracellular solute-binding protein [Chloroflexota bacterium]